MSLTCRVGDKTGRSLASTLLTFPWRYATKSLLENMDPQERAYAHLSSEMYRAPDERAKIVHGYELAEQGNDKLNDERCAVYWKCEGSGIKCVLVFRGTADSADVVDDLTLLKPIDSNPRIMSATVWAVDVMLLLFARYKGLSVTFDVTGHSLGGTVAIGVFVLLHDIPGVMKGVMDLKRKKYFGVGSDKYRTGVFEKWQGADALARTCLTVTGGHLFNPGAFPLEAEYVPTLSADAVPTAAVTATTVPAAAAVTTGPAARVSGAAGAMGAVAGGALAGPLGVLYYAFVTDMTLFRRRARGVVTHHILGDPVSCCFGMGTEKSYTAKPKKGRSSFFSRGRWGTHSIENFLE